MGGWIDGRRKEKVATEDQRNGGYSRVWAAVPFAPTPVLALPTSAAREAQRPVLSGYSGRGTPPARRLPLLALVQAEEAQLALRLDRARGRVGVLACAFITIGVGVEIGSESESERERERSVIEGAISHSLM